MRSAIGERQQQEREKNDVPNEPYKGKWGNLASYEITSATDRAKLEEQIPYPWYSRGSNGADPWTAWKNRTTGEYFIRPFGTNVFLPTCSIYTMAVSSESPGQAWIDENPFGKLWREIHIAIKVRESKRHDEN
jgi:hypothetical protein